MRQRPGGAVLVVLGIAWVLLLLLTARAWWWLPPMSRANWKVPSPCHRVLIAADGHTLATVHPTEIILWDVPAGQKRHAVPVDRANHPVPMVDVDLSPDGQSIIWGEVRLDGSVQLKLWHPRMLLGAPALLDGRVVAAFADGGRTVVTDPPLCLWDATTGARQRSFPEKHGLGMNVQVTATPDHQLLAVGWYKDGSVAVQDLGTGNERVIVPPGQALPANAAPFRTRLSDDGRWVAAMAGESLGLWDLRTGQRFAVFPWPPEKGALEPLDFSADGNLLATIHDTPERGARLLVSNRTVLWDLTTNPPRERGSADGWPRFSPDGKWLLTHLNVPQDGPSEAWVLYDTATMQRQGRLDNPDIFELKFAPDSRTLAGTVSSVPEPSQKLANPPRPELRVWEVPSFRELGALGHGEMWVYAFFPDGRSLAMRDTDGHLYIWDLPPRRAWYVEIGLPVVFVVLLLGGAYAGWHLRARALGVSPS